MWEHPDYPYHGYDMIHDDNDPIDDHSHGTHCAGTIAGNGASGIQTGIAPSTKIMAIKVVDAEGFANLSQIISGIEFAVEHGAHILSMSIGFIGGGSEDKRIQFRNAFTIAVSEDVTGKEIIRLFVKAVYKEGSNNLDFGIPVYDYIFDISKVLTDDSEGNNNGMLDWGETACSSPQPLPTIIYRIMYGEDVMNIVSKHSIRTDACPISSVLSRM